MTLDGKILRRAKQRFDDRKKACEERLLRRTAEVYRKAPEVERLDGELRQLVLDAVSKALTGAGDISDTSERSLDLQEQRVIALTRAGFPADYLDTGYICTKCSDTGYCGTHMCSCLKKLYKEEQAKELSSMLKIGVETFDAFNPDLYPDRLVAGVGVSAREHMIQVYEICLNYARRFGPKSGNLLLKGNTGLGKTFLSTCIAKVVSESGWSVVYDTAGNIFTTLEKNRFDKSDNAEEDSAAVNRYLNCDLLMIDDLGTEFLTSFVTSALYNLLNSRMLASKQTIISTNLTKDELYSRYTPQIGSRILGGFTVLNFFGDDIRLRKKN